MKIKIWMTIDMNTGKYNFNAISDTGERIDYDRLATMINRVFKEIVMKNIVGRLN